MFGSIEKRVKAGRNLRTMRCLLATGSLFVPRRDVFGIPFKRFSNLIFEGRVLIEYHADRVDAVESLVLRRVRKASLSFWAVRSYVSRVLEPGRAQRVSELMQDLNLSPGARALLQNAVSHNGAASDQTGRLAEDGLAFLRAEPNYDDLSLFTSTIFAAEMSGREDISAASLRLLLARLARIESDRRLAVKNMAKVVAARLILFDLDGAERFLATVSNAGEARELHAEVEAVAEDVRSYRHVLRQAHGDLLMRAAGTPSAVSDMPVIILPSAAFRTNKIDYPGFRSDIRFVFSAIISALEASGEPYMVRGALGRHGKIELPVPSFSYHTISDRPLGLHFKETDRPSLFSFDRRGYAGWSEFSHLTFGELPLVQVSAQEAQCFFEEEKHRVITGNLSKYRQTAVSNVGELPEKFIFVALQLVDDPVSQLAYLDLFAMLEEVVAAARTKGLSVVVKRHPLCTTPEVSQYLTELVAQGAIRQVHSSIHAIIPKAQAVCVINSGVGAEALLHEKPVYVFGRADYMAGCFVCRERGDFARQFVPGKAPLSSDDLRKFWYLLRTRYAVDLRDRQRASAEIETRVMDHLKRHGH